MRRYPLGYFAVERAAKRGYTTYGLAGCSQLRAAVGMGWLVRKGGTQADPTFLLTPSGVEIARREGWLRDDPAIESD